MDLSSGIDNGREEATMPVGSTDLVCQDSLLTRFESSVSSALPGKQLQLPAMDRPDTLDNQTQQYMRSKTKAALGLPPLSGLQPRPPLPLLPAPARQLTNSSSKQAAGKDLVAKAASKTAPSSPKHNPPPLQAQAKTARGLPPLTLKPASSLISRLRRPQALLSTLSVPKDFSRQRGLAADWTKLGDWFERVLLKLRDPDRDRVKLVCKAWLAQALCGIVSVGPEWYCSDKQVSSLRRYPHLASIELHSCAKITDASLAALRDLPLLKRLSLKGAFQITDAAIDSIQAASLLTALQLAGAKCLQKADLTPLRSLSKLDLSGCSRLRYLSLTGLRALCRVDLAGCCWLTDAGLSGLDGLVSLRSINLSGCLLAAETSRRLVLCPHLTCVFINACRYADDMLPALCDIDSLKSLSMRSCRSLRDDDLKRLAVLPDLDLLCIGDNPKLTLEAVEDLKMSSASHLRKTSLV